MARPVSCIIFDISSNIVIERGQIPYSDIGLFEKASAPPALRAPSPNTTVESSMNMYGFYVVFGEGWGGGMRIFLYHFVQFCALMFLLV